MLRVREHAHQVPVQDQDELFSFRSAYSVAHSYATQLVESDKFKFVKLKPTRIFYAGGFGVNAEWVSSGREGGVDLQAYDIRDLIYIVKTI